MAEEIPVPRKAKPTPLLHRHVFCIRRDDRWLIEQRPSRGRWAGLWQFVTLEAAADDASPSIGGLPLRVGKLVNVGEVTHALTHRRYHFAVFRCDAASSDVKKQRHPTADQPARVWVTLEGLGQFPLPRPHLKIADMLRDIQDPPRRKFKLPQKTLE